MSLTVDLRGAVHDRRGRYANKPSHEVDSSILTGQPETSPDPEPVDSLSDDSMRLLYLIANNRPLVPEGASVPSADGWDEWLASDMPGLSVDERRRLMNTLAGDLADWQLCSRALATPGLDNNETLLYRLLPPRLRDLVPKRFRVEDVDAEFDEFSGKVVGHGGLRDATAVDRATRIRGALESTIRHRIRAARLLSDSREPAERPEVFRSSDPWLEAGAEPPF